jgi:hypothetical protein
MTQRWKEHAFIDKNEIDHSIQIRNVGCSQLGGALSFGCQFLLDQSTEIQDQGYSKLPTRVVPTALCRVQTLAFCDV